MGLYDERQRYSSKGCLISMVLIALGVVVCTTTTAIVIDQACVNDAAKWIPAYPGSEVVSEQHTLFRPFGMGVTTQVLHSDDPFNKVLIWYVDLRTELSVGGERAGLSAMTYDVQKGPNGTGTRISLNARCAMP